MTQSLRAFSRPSWPLSRVPPLASGDHLTREEFERRFDATPGLKKAELIEGVVFMPPPAVSFDFHSEPHAEIVTWLTMYRSETPGVLVGDNGSVRIDPESMPQPDALLMIAKNGQATIDDDGYVAGAPELIVEVSGSSATIDSFSKRDLYLRTGVKEYIIWRTYDGEIDYFEVCEGKYVPRPADSDGYFKSAVFAGLWLDSKSLLQGNIKEVIRVLNLGLATPEHAAFVAKLNPPANPT